MMPTTDKRGVPGDLVSVRGGRPVNVYRTHDMSSTKGNLAGQVGAKAFGMIVSASTQGHTYVLWSDPCLLGWVWDGSLRSVRC